MESFAVNVQDLVLQMNSKLISRGGATKPAGAIAKKRSLKFDEWENFIILLRNWNKLASNTDSKSE
jgi:hypothetical protein